VKPSASAAERNWRVAKITGGLGAIGLAVDALVGSPLGATPIQVTAVVICAAIWSWSLLHRGVPSMTTSNLVLLILNAAIIAALTSAGQRLAESGMPWVPFRPHKLGVMAIALLAPPALWVGIVTILGFIAAAAIQFALFDPEIRARLPFGDPLSTVMFGAFALVLLFFRHRADKVERDVTRAHAEAESYQRYARAILAIRDLANTPLQTLTNVVALLRQRHPELDEEINRLERAVTRLTELDRAMRPIEQHLEWRPGDESWDPQSILQTSARRS
jgi:hypothetical protein